MKTRHRRRFPAEWEEQDAVLLAWPHAQTDWADQLEAAQQTFAAIIATISHFETVLLIAKDCQSTLDRLKSIGTNLDQVRIYPLACNDTWARDFGPLTIDKNGRRQLLNFTFNGWGGKFAAAKDNRLTADLVRHGAFASTPVQNVDMVLEGGSIETDGDGTLLTTSTCLLEPNRNPQFSRSEIEQKFKDLLGIKRVHWLEQGALEGDDTDSHIDTLVRFAPHNTLIYQGCNDPKDTHYIALKAMRKELEALRNHAGKPYHLLELPWPGACYTETGERLPATYANFLIINGAVLLPTYNDPADQRALSILATAFPEREIIPQDCRSLIRQHGSLHCITMQIAKGVIA